MNKFRFTIKLAAIAIFTLAFASMAQAQATRTWVSGVGDDVNPCSRTAPCKTFAGAISKTFINGEIDCLDPGGFGTVTITKSITLDGTHGSGFGSILSSGVNAIIINAGGSVNDPLRSVRIRNLSINGAGASGAVGTRTGLRGIKILSALDVYIEGCVIDNFSDRGISDERAAGTGKLRITDTIVKNTGGSNIVVIPTGAATINVHIDNVHAENSGTNSGIVFDGTGGTIKASVADSYATGNASSGLFVASATSDVMVDRCIISNNLTGITANSGTVGLANSTVTHNGTSMPAGTQAHVSSAGNNAITANTANNLPTGPGIPPS